MSSKSSSHRDSIERMAGSSKILPLDGAGELGGGSDYDKSLDIILIKVNVRFSQA